MKWIANILLFLAAAAASLVAVEVGYRVYLEDRLQNLAETEVEDDPAPSFGFYAYPAPWKFDAAQGFVFNEGSWHTGNITKGAFGGCNIGDRGNNYGNVGKDISNYDSADVKIAILGSSFTLLANSDGDLVNNLLQRRLSEKLGKSVSILNFSRDATGLLTSFDIARAKFEELRPDILLFVFNVTQLAYQRHWRVLEPLDTGFWRLVFSLDPNLNLRDRDRVAIQSQIVSDRVGADWCERMEEARRRNDEEVLHNDPVVRDLISAHRRARRDMAMPQFIVDHWDLSRSFIYNAVANGDPYYMVQIFKERTVYAPHGYRTFGEDGRFLDALKFLQGSGVPFLLVHIPTLDEMRAGPEGPFVYGVTALPADREQALAESLEELAGQEIVHLFAYYDAALKSEPLGLVYGEKNSHPSPLGTEAMAGALEALILERPDTRAVLGLPRKSADAK